MPTIAIATASRPATNRSARRRFAGDERGTIAILFALLLVPILGIVFGGIDYSRAMSVQNQLQTAADSAARSAASRLSEGSVKAEAAFKAAFQANLPEDLKDQPYDLSITGNGRVLQVEVATSVPTTLIGLLGVSKLDVAVAATAARPDPQLLTRKGGAGNGPFAGLPDLPETARARADLDRAARSAGFPAPKVADTGPDPEDVERARREIESALRAAGLSVNLPRQQDLPDPAQLERMQREIMQELGRLRF